MTSTPPASAPPGGDATARDAHQDTELAGGRGRGAAIRGGAAAEPSLGSMAPNSEDEAAARVGSVLAERYRIEALLGSGGMGSVYRAEHVLMRKTVAVKVLHREMTYLPEVVARFEREAIAAARIEHPHVAAATDFGRLDDGSFYLVLEYVEGRSLRAVIRETGPLFEPRAAWIVRQIADALAAAHAAGVVHRDLKPDNVMLVEREGDPDFVKVLDFGIAKVSSDGAAEQPALTQLGSVFGTPEYMAPEQAAGSPVDARADLYTLGIIFYELLAGVTPFAHDDLVAVLTRQMTEPPPELPASVDPEIRALVSVLLAKEPEARVQSARELVEHLDASLARLAPSAAHTGASPGPPPMSWSPSPPPPSAVSAESAAHPSAATRAILPVKPGRAMTRTVMLGKYPVPLVVLVVAGAALLAGVLLVVALAAVGLGGHAGGAPSASSSAALAPPPPELAEVAARAERGEASALVELEARTRGKRGASEWRALGHGYALTGERVKSVAAYASALDLAPVLASDPVVVKDVRDATRSALSQDGALELASRMGPAGADILYEASSSSDKTLAAAARKRFDEPAVQARVSPALEVALKLRAARTCAAKKLILPAAVEHADARSAKQLQALGATRGCGFLGLGDCWSCLRGDGRLKQALERARSTPAPSFDAE